MNAKYARQVFAAAIAGAFLAFLLLCIKLCAWWYTGSVSMLAALVDSLVDIAASLTNLLIVRYAVQPPDAEHTFGHGKAESLAVLAQSIFICSSAFFLFFAGFHHFTSPQVLKEPLVGVVVTLISLLSTIVLVVFQRRIIRRTQSQAIRADMLHYQSDIVMNSVIFLAIALSWYGFYRADALCALYVGIWILYSSGRMAYEAIQALLDRSLPPKEYQLIIDVISMWPGICGAHDIRTRQVGPIRFIQLHLEMDDQLSLYEAHKIVDQIEKALLDTFPSSDVLIHQDPHSVVDKQRQGTFGK
ncbi:CDF family cation-efflux transporter FieF [Candidatus Erwinia haradaeae]|uniref:Cation-efflux pump FieF n=1 Tax=Candidatus Erwinia haradaeae TaxID=1922217 RepID=A0A803FSV5_9GAMM|nr:CDF family cation-efflux transporter FieF [Candidatus Erwinia haradaeae]VFP87193.1 Ferrous-iron efflux pump FieF [Candidatus Erwinia haradaeae]